MRLYVIIKTPLLLIIFLVNKQINSKQTMIQQSDDS